MQRLTQALRFPLAIIFTALLSACGGGGGATVTTTPPPATGLAVTVKVNNAVVTPVANVVTIGSGDTVTIETAKVSVWASSGGAPVTNNVVTSQSWSARLAKQDTAQANYTVSASSGTESATVTFNIPAGDPRNGEYKFFSANASEYTLRIDFDASQYSVRSGASVIASGTFSAAIDGTHTFNVPGYAPARNNARFRASQGIIVGSHPVGGAEALPFLASNHFVTAAADLPLTNLWMFASDGSTTSAVVNSRIQSIRLLGNQITYCSVAVGAVTTVANCLPGNLSTNVLVFNADRSITWDDAGTAVNLHVVRAGNELILIRSQSYAAGSGNKRFQIALDDSKATTGDYEGGISNGSWGISTLSATTFNRLAFASSAATDNLTGTLNSAGPTAMPLRVAAGGDGVSYFVQGSGALGVHIAARDSAKAGLVGFGLKR